jgi:hypothetical protein
MFRNGKSLAEYAGKGNSTIGCKITELLANNKRKKSGNRSKKISEAPKIEDYQWLTWIVISELAGEID